MVDSSSSNNNNICMCSMCTQIFNSLNFSLQNFVALYTIYLLIYVCIMSIHQYYCMYVYVSRYILFYALIIIN